MRKLALAVFLGVAAVGCLAGPGHVPNSQKAIEERLTCQCGCGLTVHACNHLQCGFAVPTKEDIAKSLAAGQTGDEIIARYVAKYGEKILSSPTPTGFNLVAWYGPYAALALGLVGVVFLIRRWLGVEEPAAESRALSDQDRKRLERELEELEL